MRGRKPKPTVLKDLHRSEEPRNIHEPIPVGNLDDGSTKCPDYFNAEQRDAWEYVARHSPPQMLKLIDAALLEAWVVAYCLHRQAAQKMDGAPLTVSSPKSGFPVQNPLIPMISRQALIMAKLASELGFSPTARPRVMVAQSQVKGMLTASVAARNAIDAPDQSIEEYLATAPTVSMN